VICMMMTKRNNRNGRDEKRKEWRKGKE